MAKTPKRTKNAALLAFEAMNPTVEPVVEISKNPFADRIAASEIKVFEDTHTVLRSMFREKIFSKKKIIFGKVVGYTDRSGMIWLSPFGASLLSDSFKNKLLKLKEKSLKTLEDEEYLECSADLYVDVENAKFVLTTDEGGKFKTFKESLTKEMMLKFFEV